MTAPYNRVYTDDAVGQNRRRIRNLENAQVGNSVVITDGITTVDPLLQLDIGPGLELTATSISGEAELSITDYLSFTPTLDAISGSGTDPSIGGGGTPFGRYVKINQFVHYWGSMLFGSGTATGTGLWQVDLPVPVTFPDEGLALGGANIHCHTCISNVGKQMMMEAQQTTVGGFTPDASHIAFYYTSAYPYGTLSMFDHTAPYTPIGVGDLLSWNIVYQTAT